MTAPNFNIEANLEQNSYAAAEFLIQSATAAIRNKGRFIVSLAGGSTPKRMYEILSEPPFKDALPWDKVYVIWGDERCVPDDSPESNSRMAREAWLNQVAIPEGNIYAIDGTLPPEEAAAQYETELRELFQGDQPAIDLCLLGLGDDGHTASLFPHTTILEERQKWVREVYVEKMQSWRITLTVPIIRAATQIAFLVSGAKKVDILPKVLYGPHMPEEYPSQFIIKENPAVYWFLDEAAAAGLK